MNLSRTEERALLLETELGIGAVLDRDLAAVLKRLAEERGNAVDRLIDSVMQGSAGKIRLHGSYAGERDPRRGCAFGFGFVPRPAPKPSESEC